MNVWKDHQVKKVVVVRLKLVGADWNTLKVTCLTLHGPSPKSLGWALCPGQNGAQARKITTLVHLDWNIKKLKVSMTTQKIQGLNRSLISKPVVVTMSILQKTVREKD